MDASGNIPFPQDEPARPGNDYRHRPGFILVRRMIDKRSQK
jgi:hypothetical protein